MENRRFSMFSIYSENNNSDKSNGQPNMKDEYHDGHSMDFTRYRESSNYTAFYSNYNYSSSNSRRDSGQGSDLKSNVIQQADKQKRRKAKSNQKPWLLILKNYTEISTFHGLFHIVAAQPFLIRRLLWLLLFLGCTALLIMQITSNVQYYLKWPMYVDVRINYNDSIQFPAVTICNQNAFRSTVTYNASIYDVVSSLYIQAEAHEQDGGSGHMIPNIEEFQENPASHMTLDELYFMAGHNAEDLIVGCEWHGAKCSHLDFTPTLTDTGLCYTFNGLPGDNRRWALQTGSEGGLRLHLNIEQYEYMKGPNSGAGIKLQVHNPEEPPLVRDQGIAIPPGMQAFAAVKTFEIRNLKKPHGKCNDSVDLDYYKDYTMTTCKVNCKQKYVLKHCGCRDIHMSSKSDSKIQGSGVCTLDEYVDCLQPTLQSFGTVSGTICDCPVPCYRLAYEASVSYASTSNYDIHSLLYDNSTRTSLSDKFVAANNVQQRVSDAIVETDLNMMTQLNESIVNIDAILDRLLDKLPLDRIAMEHMYVDVLKRVDFHQREGLNNVLYIIEHDFVRGWTIGRERAFNYVTHDYFHLSEQFRRGLQEHAMLMENSTEESRRLITFPLVNIAQGRIACIERAYEFLNETQEGYENGIPLVLYRTTYNRHYDMSYIPFDILRTGLDRSTRYYDKIKLSLGQITDGLNMMINLCHDFALSGYFNETLFTEADYWIQKGSRSYNYRIFQYETRLVYPPLEEMNDIIEYFQLVNRTLATNHYEYLRKNTELKEFILNFQATHLTLLKQFNLQTAHYYHNQTYTKSELSQFAASDEMQELSGFLNFFFVDLRDRLYGLQQQMTQVALSYKDLWETMVTEPSTQTFYQQVYNDSLDFLYANMSDPSIDEDFLWTLFSHMLLMDEDMQSFRNYSKEQVLELMNADFYMMNITEKRLGIERDFSELTTDLEASTLIQFHDEHLRNCFMEFIESLRDFTENNKMDSEFYRQNFMRLEVFMQELSYEEIRQEASYESSQLLSDIGGSVGLFIGGSVMSLFEVFDVFVHNAFRRLLNR